jgi:DNA end-binding protein Ku
MPRSLWRGSLSFGLVNVPVAMFSAVKDIDIHFNQIDRESGKRLHVERVCKEEDVEIPYDEIASGYPKSDGEGYVLLTDEDLAAAQPEKTRTIDIDEFVDLDEIDPIYFDHPYFLAPVGDGDGPLRAYKLLVEAMSAAGGKVAIGRFVLRSKEYLVALRVREGLIQLNTMVFHDEVRSTDQLPLPSGKADEPSKDEVKQAVALVEQLSAEWDPSKYEDRHTKRLRDIVNKKRKGQTIKAPAEQEVPAAVPDLMAALRESLEAAKSDGKKRTTKSSPGTKSKPKEKAKA